MDRARCRKIVKMASESVQATEVKSWLFRDERGTHELYAAELLEKVAALPPERTAGLSEAQIDEELAAYVALAALNATISHYKQTDGE